MGSENLQPLADLFQETGTAHHQAFIATDGVDPEWASWYAQYLVEKLPSLLNATLPESEIAILLETASEKHAAQDPDADWKVFYAKFFMEQTQ